MLKIRVLFVFLFLASFALAAQDLPQPEGWVNDFAHVISGEYRDKLNALIQELEEKTSTEIAVVTISSIAPYDEKEYARLLFDNWKPGKKGKDNGVLVLLAIKERRWRIETGYGVEGVLPDGLCGEIGRNYMVPFFLDGRYAEGLYQGVIKIAKVISGEAPVIGPTDKSIGSRFIRKADFLWRSIPFWFFAIYIFIAPWQGFFMGVLIVIFVLLLLRLVSFLPVFLAAFFILGILKLILPFELLRGKDDEGYWDMSDTGGGFGGGGWGGGGFGGGGGGGGGAGGGF